MSAVAIQDRLLPGLNCFGCGPRNTRGLQLKSFSEGDIVVAEFFPWPEHDNGTGFLNGGIIATVLDCHSAAAVVAVADQMGWKPLGDTALSYITAGIAVDYKRPAPLDQAVELRARITDGSEAEILCSAELWHDDKVRATGRSTWKRWRPR